MLAEKGQYMPFDPPLAERGATVGGTVAAGLSGAGRYRYGGIRDFLIGIRFVNGRGQEIRGGGAVSKKTRPASTSLNCSSAVWGGWAF